MVFCRALDGVSLPVRRFCGEAFGVVGLRIGVVEVVVWSLA